MCVHKVIDVNKYTYMKSVLKVIDVNKYTNIRSVLKVISENVNGDKVAKPATGNPFKSR
jgi:hypothetical protein